MSAGAHSVIRYYRSRESRWGYRWLLKGVKHYGYYPLGKERISIGAAQYLMEEHLAETLGLPSGSLVLDAGCGEGNVAHHLADQHGLKVRGVDLLDFNIARAKRKARQSGLDLELEVGDYHSLKYPDRTFDAVYTMETLEHSREPDRALREFYRVLKPGGKVVLFEYTIPPDDQLTENDRQAWSEVIKGSAMPGLLLFRHDSFPEHLAKAGFTRVRTEDITARTMPLLRRFYRWAIIPYQLIKLLGKREKYANATAGATMYQAALKRDAWRYVVVSAYKP